MRTRLRIIVTGMVAQYPIGGVAWDYLQYVVGFARLGHDVYYHEDTWSWPYHPIRNIAVEEGTYSADYLRDFFDRYAPDLATHWHYRHLSQVSYGMTKEQFDAVARSADLFVNVSGASTPPEALSPHCRKVFIDSDPGYNQIVMSEKPSWSENLEYWLADIAAHDRHFTYAENVDGADCALPEVGYDWIPTRMPVVMEYWDKIPPARAGAPWTTVMSWSVFRGKLIYRGVEYGGKHVEFEKIADLPRRVSVPITLAFGGKEEFRKRPVEAGWNVVDGPTATLTPGTYQDFVAGSRGEVSIAKQTYVALRTGWFSCRTACYLAAGRPAVVQDTGFAGIVPTGRGVIAFDTVEQAAVGIAEVEADYARHAVAARDIAREHFGADKVLGRLIEDAFDGE